MDLNCAIVPTMSRKSRPARNELRNLRQDLRFGVADLGRTPNYRVPQRTADLEIGRRLVHDEALQSYEAHFSERSRDRRMARSPSRVGENAQTDVTAFDDAFTELDSDLEFLM